jgi:hypothetical protein
MHAPLQTPLIAGQPVSCRLRIAADIISLLLPAACLSALLCRRFVGVATVWCWTGAAGCTAAAR